MKSLLLVRNQLQSDSSIRGVIGGPIGAFNHLADQTGVNAAVSWMMTTVEQVKNFRPRTDFNSIEWKPDDAMIEHARQEGLISPEDLMHLQKEHEEDVEAEDRKELVCGSRCGIFTVQGEFKRFMEHQNAGLHTDYKCVKCRNCGDCLKGAMFERVSIRSEGEQQLIKESVWIDPDRQEAKAKLAFIMDPAVHLKDNRHIALKRLESVCRKYSRDPEVVDSIQKVERKGLHQDGFRTHNRTAADAFWQQD